MAVVEIKVDQFQRVLKKYLKKSKEEIKQASIETVVDYVPKLVKESPVDTGEYAASWDTSEEHDRVLLGNFAPHAPIIEFGARPFTPPLKPLLAWAKRVLKSGSQPPDYEPKVWALARATQRKIAKEGMQPKHVLTNAIPKILEDIKSRLDAL